MPEIHFDYETRSYADLKTVGASRYGFDHTTQVMCAALSYGDEAPVLWVPPAFRSVVASNPDAEDLIDMMGDDDVVIYAHNAPFEIAINEGCWLKTFGKRFRKPDPRQFRCTAAMARRAGLPYSLAKVGEALNLPQQKDKGGSALIYTFSVPQKKGEMIGRFIQPHERPSQFKAFCDYCLQDVRVEKMVHTALAPFELKGFVLETFQLDLAINTRGLKVNVPALRHTQTLIAEGTATLTEDFRKVTGFNPTQDKVFKAWLKERGSPLANLQAETLDEILEDADFDATTEVGKALTIRKMIGYASVKKVATMLAAVGPHDDRLRGMLLWYGAGTGRWSSVLVQLQNLKRPTIKNTKNAYAAICAGVPADIIKCVYGEVLEVISSCVRHFIQDTDTGEMFDADYAAIEARIVNWLAGQADAVQEFANGVDRYKKMAAVIYGKPASEINAFPERFVGKQATLGCGFQMGAAKFRGTCANYGYELPEGLEFTAVEAFRETHAEVAKLWRLVDQAAKNAIKFKGRTFQAGEKLKFFCADVAGIPFLFLKLPSGRNLAYPYPKIEPVLKYMCKGKMVEVFSPTAEELVRGRKYDPECQPMPNVTFWGQLKNSSKWGRISTYGGKLTENATQAVAADIMGFGGITAEKHGYEIAVLVHDQALVYKKPGQTIEELVKHLTTLPPWADGLPIASDGKVVAYYSK